VVAATADALQWKRNLRSRPEGANRRAPRRAVLYTEGDCRLLTPKTFRAHCPGEPPLVKLYCRMRRLRFCVGRAVRIDSKHAAAAKRRNRNNNNNNYYNYYYYYYYYYY
jgi:hypothetical protein